MSHANRGRSFEQAIEAINTEYEARGIASVDKIPTDWVVRRVGPKIVSAFPRKKSGVDFVGVLGAKPIYFDAKESKNKTRFPLSNIEFHQRMYLLKKRALGAITFFLIRMDSLARVFLVDVPTVEMAIEAGKASLTVKDLEACLEVPMKDGLPDYLAPLREMVKKVRA